MPESESSLAQRLESIRGTLQTLDEAAAIDFFALKDFNVLLKTTISLCPDCLVHVPAVVFTNQKRVWMRKVCKKHGPVTCLMENDENFYHLSNKDRWGRKFASDKVMTFPAFNGGCCGEENSCSAASEFNENFADQSANKSCTILVEVTNACNLSCPVCYSDARGDRKMPLAVFKEYISRLIESRKILDSVQLTGGEAALHPEFWDMVAFLHAQPQVKKIYLPTNGIIFANPEIAARCLPFRDKMMVLLQFDGKTVQASHAMRDANTTQVRDRVIENFSQHGIHMQLTMTITQGVNDHEVGWVVEKGLQHSHIKVVALQPATYSGRYKLGQNPTGRMTLSDCVKAVATQVRQRTSIDDFKPIPCSHPNCGWITLFVQRFGLTANIARHIDLEGAMNRVSNRTLLNSSELRSVIGSEQKSLIHQIGAWAGRKMVRSTDVFAIAIKPFMDKFNYDQDRISACCHHLLDTEGNATSFCEYNARLRPLDSWESFPLLKQQAETLAAPTQ